MSALKELLLSFADDEHLMGQQHTEWIGVAPFLEEDLAFASIGQDELGHAVMLYELVCELDGVEPTDEAIDALAYGRSAAEYRSCGLVEYTTTNWAEALVRHWIYDEVEHASWNLMAASTFVPLAEVAARVAREEEYHRRHANALLDVLLAQDQSRGVLHDALAVIGPMVSGLLAPLDGEEQLIDDGIIAATLATVVKPIELAISDRFGLPVTIEEAAPRGAERSEHFEPLMTRMREVLDLDPTAQW